MALLNYIPLPNLPGTTQNYHYITSAANNTDAFSLRLIHNFSWNQDQERDLVADGRGGSWPPEQY